MDTSSAPFARRGIGAHVGLEIAFGSEPGKITSVSIRRANHFGFAEIVSSPKVKNISLFISVNQNYNFARLAPTRGAYHDRHDTWGAGCDGRFGVRCE